MEIKGVTINSGDLVFVPLGGSNEIGMNMNLYHFAGKWLIVDLGISFGDDTMPGVDVLVPDPSFIEQRRENLLGIVITHGHEDHIGGIPHLWERLRCPIFATPFAASLIRRKLIEKGIAPEQARFVLPQGMYTEWYWTGSLAAYARVVRQRDDSHAQWEVREYAKAISSSIENLFPVSWKYLTANNK